MNKAAEIAFSMTISLTLLTVTFLIATWITTATMWLGGYECGFWPWSTCTLKGTT